MCSLDYKRLVLFIQHASLTDELWNAIYINQILFKNICSLSNDICKMLTSWIPYGDDDVSVGVFFLIAMKWLSQSKIENISL